MADNLDLLILPNQGDSSIVLSEPRSILAARGRKDAAGLAVHWSDSELLATVRLDSEGGRAGKKFGLINKRGAFVIEPIYDVPIIFRCGRSRFFGSPFTEQFLRITKQWLPDPFQAPRGHLGYLDREGKVVIPPIFDSARVFSEGLAGVEIEGKWGFIDKGGIVAIDPLFEGVRDFNAGLAIAKRGGKCGFIDRLGQFVIEPRFDYLSEFSEGLANATINGEGGYIDHSGVFIIEPGFKHGGSFLGGTAQVWAEGKSCLIDRAGRIIYRCAEKDQTVYPNSEGVALVRKRHDPDVRAERQGFYIDSFGRPIFRDGSLNTWFDFHEGLGVVSQTRDGRKSFGYVDAKGNLAISPQFSGASSFSEGLAAVRPYGAKEYGFIDQAGNMVISPRFPAPKGFCNGMAQISDISAIDTVGPSSRLRKWGYVDKSGEIVVACQFGQAEDFGRVTT